MAMVTDQIAHNAATDADLVLFMITDDDPQASEAEHLARLRIMGRTVLGVRNVKLGIRQGNVTPFSCATCPQSSMKRS